MFKNEKATVKEGEDFVTREGEYRQNHPLSEQTQNQNRARTNRRNIRTMNALPENYFANRHQQRFEQRTMQRQPFLPFSNDWQPQNEESDSDSQATFSRQNSFSSDVSSNSSRRGSWTSQDYENNAFLDIDTNNGTQNSRDSQFHRENIRYMAEGFVHQMSFENNSNVHNGTFLGTVQTPIYGVQRVFLNEDFSRESAGYNVTEDANNTANWIMSLGSQLQNSTTLNNNDSDNMNSTLQRRNSSNNAHIMGEQVLDADTLPQDAFNSFTDTQHPNSSRAHMNNVMLADTQSMNAMETQTQSQHSTQHNPGDEFMEE